MTSGPTSTTSEASETIALLQEELDVSKRTVVTGKVRIHVLTDIEDATAVAGIAREEVEVTRKPIGRLVDQAPNIRTEGDVTIIPILEEVAVVETRLRLKEEVHIRRIRNQENVELPVSLRKQRANIQHVTSDSETETEPPENEQ